MNNDSHGWEQMRKERKTAIICIIILVITLILAGVAAGPDEAFGQETCSTMTIIGYEETDSRLFVLVVDDNGDIWAIPLKEELASRTIVEVCRTLSVVKRTESGTPIYIATDIHIKEVE